MGRRQSHSIYILRECGIIRYVGISKHPGRRKYEHFRYQGTSNSAIPSNVNLMGVTFEIVEKYYDRNIALIREGLLIKEYDTIRSGWNKNNSGVSKQENNNNKQDKYDKLGNVPPNDILENSIIHGVTTDGNKTIKLIITSNGEIYYF